MSPVEEDQHGAAVAEESDLLARLRAGDERAFEGLVETHRHDDRRRPHLREDARRR